MRTVISRWFMFGLLLGGAISHATVFAQGTGTSSSPAQPAGQGVAQPGVAQPGFAPPGFAQPGQPPLVKVAGMSLEKIRAGLDKSVTIDYTGQSLSDVLSHFRDRTGLAINVDQMAFMHMGGHGEFPMAQVELKAKNEKASSVLRKLLNGHRLNYVILEDSVLITTEEMAMLRQMRQRVNVNVDDVPLKKAASELAKNHGINLVFDPLVKQTIDTNVSLQLENTGAETALRLLAEMANLKAVRMGNVIFITNETKAKKLREEETHQFDNLLNPNIPGGGPPIAIGAFGGIGFGGGIRGGGVPGNPGIVPPDGPMGFPQPGIDLPRAVPQPGGADTPVQSPPAKKVIDIRNPMPPPPPLPGAAPAVNLPLRVPQPMQREPNER